MCFVLLTTSKSEFHILKKEPAEFKARDAVLEKQIVSIQVRDPESSVNKVSKYFFIIGYYSVILLQYI